MDKKEISHTELYKKLQILSMYMSMPKEQYDGNNIIENLDEDLCRTYSLLQQQQDAGIDKIIIPEPMLHQIYEKYHNNNTVLRELTDTHILPEALSHKILTNSEYYKSGFARSFYSTNYYEKCILTNLIRNEMYNKDAEMLITAIGEPEQFVPKFQIRNVSAPCIRENIMQILAEKAIQRFLTTETENVLSPLVWVKDKEWLAKTAAEYNNAFINSAIANNKYLDFSRPEDAEFLMDMYFSGGFTSKIPPPFFEPITKEWGEVIMTAANTGTPQEQKQAMCSLKELMLANVLCEEHEIEYAKKIINEICNEGSRASVAYQRLMPLYNSKNPDVFRMSAELPSYKDREMFLKSETAPQDLLQDAMAVALKKIKAKVRNGKQREISDSWIETIADYVQRAPLIGNAEDYKIVMKEGSLRTQTQILTSPHVPKEVLRAVLDDRDEVCAFSTCTAVAKLNLELRDNVSIETMSRLNRYFKSAGTNYEYVTIKEMPATPKTKAGESIRHRTATIINGSAGRALWEVVEKSSEAELKQIQDTCQKIIEGSDLSEPEKAFPKYLLNAINELIKEKQQDEKNKNGALSEKSDAYIIDKLIRYWQAALIQDDYAKVYDDYEKFTELYDEAVRRGFFCEEIIEYDQPKAEPTHHEEYEKECPR